MQILHISEIHSKVLLIRKPKVYITAKNSFIAKNILEQLDYDFTATTHTELDLTSSKAVDTFFKDKYFDYIIHTACAGGRRKNEPQKIFEDNFNMFDNLALRNKGHYGKFINFGSGADRLETWYGKAKRVIRGIIKENPNMINLRLFGCWGKYEKPDRFPAYCLTHKQVTIEDKLMRYIHVDELVKIVDSIIKHWPIYKREITLGEPVKLSDFAKFLNPKIKVIIKGKGKDYI